MSMLSGSMLGGGGDRPRRRHPVATAILVVLMMGVLFAATFGAVRLLKGDGSASSTGTTPTTCVSTTMTPGASLPKPGTITVNVYNATNRAGLARNTAATLRERGFGIGSIANDPLGKSLTNVGEIRYGAKGKQNALLLRYYVVGAVLVQDARTDTTVDVVLGLKFTAVTEQTAVDAALAKPVVVATGTGCPSPTPKSTSRSASSTPSKA